MRDSPGPLSQLSSQSGFGIQYDQKDIGAMQEMNRLPVIYRHSNLDVGHVDESHAGDITSKNIKSGEKSITFDETVNIKIKMSNNRDSSSVNRIKSEDAADSNKGK